MTKYVILSKKNWVEFIATMVADWIKRNIVIDDLESVSYTHLRAHETF